MNGDALRFPVTPRRRRLRRLLAAGGVVLAVLVVATVAWLFSTESGLRTLAGAVTRFSGGMLHIEGVGGALRGPFSISRLTLDLPEAKVELAGLSCDWQPSALFARKLVITRLRVEEGDVFLRESQTEPEPLSFPEDLLPPFDVDLAAVEIGRLKLFGHDSESTESADESATAPLFVLTESSLSLAADAERFHLRRLVLELDGANPAAFAPDLPHAQLRLRANLAMEDADGASVLRGPISIDNARPATLDAGGLPVSALNMETRISAALDELRFDSLTLEGGGGELLGWLRWRKTPEKDETRPAGTALLAGLGRIEANIEARGVDPSLADSRLPSRRVDARLEMEATEARQQGKLSLHTAGMRAEGEGEILSGDVNTPVFVLNLALHDFDPAAFFPASPPASINLHAALSGTLAEKPTIAINYTFGESRFNGKPLAGNGLLTWDGDHVRNADIKFNIAGNHLQLTGGWGEIHDHLNFEIDAPRLGEIGFGLAGKLRADGFVTGALEAPAGAITIAAEKLNVPEVVGIASITGEARIAGGECGPLSIHLKATKLAAGDAHFATAAITAEGQRDRHTIHADVDGRIGKDPMILKMALEGGLKGVRWQGRLAALESSGRWQLRLRAPAAMVLGIEPEEFSLLDAEFDIQSTPPAPRRNRAARNTSTNNDEAPKLGLLHLIETRWQNDAATLRGKLTGLPAAKIPGLEQSGRRDSLVFGGDWDLQLGERIEGRARFFRESGDLSVRGELSTRIGLERFETYLVARQNKLTLVLATHGREIGELGVSLEAEIERAGRGWRLAPHVPISGAARLDMPSIAWLGRMARENIEVGGSLSADVTLAGTPEAPDLRGRVRGSGLQFSLVDQGLLLAGGQLEAEFIHRDGRQRLRLTKLEFESPNRVEPADKRLPVNELTATPGRLRVTGDIALGTQEEAAPRGQLEFTAERLPLLQRSDRWLIVSGEGRAGLQGMALNVQAQIRADAGYIAIDEMLPPSLSDDVIVRSANEEESAPSADGDGGVAIAGNITVDLGRTLYLSAFGVDTRLVGKLDVELRPFEPPRALGAIRTVGGTWRGYGQRLNIERGTMTFQGDPVNPAINITAMRRGMEVEAGVQILGDVRHPLVTLVSEPAVPEHEKLSWLILGRAPDSGGSDMALLLPAAQALFGGGMTDDIGSRLGFDTFTVGQGDLNSSTRSATSRVVGSGSRINSGPITESEVVSVGKRITNDLSLSFEQSLSGVESLVKLTYRVSRELSLVARGGTDNTLDLYYTYVLRSREWREREKARQRERENE